MNIPRVVTSTGEWISASLESYERRQESEFTSVSVSINPYLGYFGRGIFYAEGVIDTRLHLLVQPLDLFFLPV